MQGPEHHWLLLHRSIDLGPEQLSLLRERGELRRGRSPSAHPLSIARRQFEAACKHFNASGGGDLGRAANFGTDTFKIFISRGFAAYLETNCRDLSYCE